MYTPYDAEKYPKRKSPRLAGYDYSTRNFYFVTVCTYEKRCIFGKAGQVNMLGKLAAEGFDQIANHYPGVIVEKYVVMPNHIHAVIFLTDEKSKLENVIGSYKSFVSREIHKGKPGMKVWQNSFHDHIIRNEKSYQNIWQYIDSNPEKWNEDCFYVEENCG